MPPMTVKQLGDRIRKNLADAQKNGVIPRGVRCEVRATNTSRTGPAVNITVTGVEELIPGYPDPDLMAANAGGWMKAGGGAKLLDFVDKIRNAFNPDPPVYGGTAKFGRVFLSARVTGTREESS